MSSGVAVEAIADGAAALFSAKLEDADTPGFFVLCQPDEAEAMGAFAETALDAEEALAGSFDR
ncbi:MAG: hypothetical protein LBV15_03285 [Planctomycetota bacterium]|jgi:hypothetical protein|nr:hypothetical protein [Planctomycetota bacterium]